MDLGPRTLWVNSTLARTSFVTQLSLSFPLGLDPRPPQISKPTRVQVLYTMAWYLHEICTVLLYTLNHLLVTLPNTVAGKWQIRVLCFETSWNCFGIFSTGSRLNLWMWNRWIQRATVYCFFLPGWVSWFMSESYKLAVVIPLATIYGCLD